MPVLCTCISRVQGGDLAALIQRQAVARRYISEDEVLLTFAQICLALWHVHSQGILHRDLKPGNVFIGAGGIVKLGDFGIAQGRNCKHSHPKDIQGTPCYLVRRQLLYERKDLGSAGYDGISSCPCGSTGTLAAGHRTVLSDSGFTQTHVLLLQAPELCDGQAHSTKSDVWALGCILYELATLKRAFDGKSLPAVVVKILQGSLPPVPSKYTGNLRSLTLSMLAQDPAQRPSVDAILRQPWLRPHLERFSRLMMQVQYTQMISKPIVQPTDVQQHAAAASGVPCSQSTISTSLPCGIASWH